MSRIGPPSEVRCDECGQPIANLREVGLGRWTEALMEQRARGGPVIRQSNPSYRWVCRGCMTMFDPRTNTTTEPLF